MTPDHDGHSRLVALSAGGHVEGNVQDPKWRQIPREVWDELGRDHVSMMAGGVAFYTLLSIFPGLSALISIYGLVADPSGVESQLDALALVLPAEALKLLSDQMYSLVHAPPATLGAGLLFSLLLALWSAMSGTSMLMQALTIACDEKEDRNVVRFYLTAAALTAGLVLSGLLSLLLVEVTPALLDRLPFPDFWREAASFIRWPVLAGLAVTGLAIVYRFAPCRYGKQWRWISPGAIAATLLWIVGSAGFSFYVSRFGSYDKTYGSIGAVVVLLMWFYVTAYIILAGAELDTAIEHRTSRHMVSGQKT